MQKLAEYASYASWKQARLVLEEVANALSAWPQVATKLGVSADTVKLVQQQLNAAFEQNKGLLS